MKAKFTYWKEPDGKYPGYLHSHPDHWTQGDALDDLKAHLRDLHEMFSAEDIPGIRKVAELEVALKRRDSVAALEEAGPTRR